MGRNRITHEALLGRVVAAHRSRFSDHPVFVETGSGITTPTIARLARETGAIAFSCDINEAKVDRLRELAGPLLDGVRFLVGDSVRSIGVVAEDFRRIDLLFLDAAASALHTFREFQAAEPALGPGSVVVVDNAIIPGGDHSRSPARKGKVLVPYLLASPWWEVTAHPDAGDSMVVAVRSDTPGHSDPDYEWPDYDDPWERVLTQHFGSG